MMNTNCLLCGVGGQGTVLASKLISAAAMKKGLKARSAETIGMAQRGGCVVSHVRIGDQIYSPLIPKGGADVIIAFEPAEAVRCLPYLKKNGTVIVNTKPVIPVTASLGIGNYTGAEMIQYLREHVQNLIIVNGDEIAEKLHSAKALNVALLGAAAKSGALGLSIEELEDVILERIPEKFRELNLNALHILSI